VSANRFSIGAIRKLHGQVERFGVHKRTGKFVRWSSPRGRALRARRKLEGKVTLQQRDEFRAWARSRSLIPRSERIAVTKPPLRLRALREARGLLGVLERGGNNRGPQVDKIISENDGALGEPWCGDFAAYVYRRAGSKAVQRGWASTSLIGRLAGMTSHDARAGRPGDLVVFDFPGGGADSDHVGLLVHYANKDGKKVAPAKATHVRTLDGNSRVGRGKQGVGYQTRKLDLVNRTVRVRR
jgi:hypothetical protein